VDTKDILMHIDRANEVTVARKAAAAADPISSLGLLTMPAARTPARCASFGAGEAQDAGLHGFVGEVVDIAAVFPQGHPLVVMSAGVLGADAMRVADEERSHSVLDAEVDDRPGGLVPQVAHASLSPSADLVPGVLQFLPTTGMLLAAALLFGKLPELSVSLALERANAASGDDERRALARGHGSKVDFSEIDGCLNRPGSVFRLRDFHAHVQFKAVVPDKRTGPGVLGMGEWQDERRAALAHRQDHSPLLNAHCLRGPVDGVEALLAPGVLHPHLGMLPAQLAGRFDGAEEGAEDGLYRLAVQGKTPFGQLVQIVLVGPAGMALSGPPMGLDADVPDLGRFHLRRFEAAEDAGRQGSQAIRARCFHRYLFFSATRKTVKCCMGNSLGGVAFIRLHTIIANLLAGASHSHS